MPRLASLNPALAVPARSLGAVAYGALFAAAACGSALAGDSETKLDSVFKSVKSAVVRIAYTEDGHSGVGAIVTKEGHVILHQAAHLQGKKLIVFLPNGRRAKGELLGWSSEWNVSVAKITDAGPWPFVEMASARQSPGEDDRCFAVGYTLEEKGWRASPERRTGRVVRTGRPFWFASSIRGSPEGEPYFAFGPVFAADGKLLGNTAVQPVGGDSIQLHARQIHALWKQLLQGGPSDKERLFGGAPEHEKDRPYTVGDLDSRRRPTAAEVERRVVSCTVGLRGKGGGRWSGVIVSPDGWIATCAHGGQMPGERIAVELPDGRDATGRVTGVNPIADIALVKIQDKGRWPYAPLCDSSRVAPGTPCWFVGYPAGREGRTPLVRKTKTARDEGPQWSHLLYTDSAYSQHGGDSGGGVFDLSGRLLAINQGKEPGRPGRHPRAETLRAQWGSLAEKGK